MKISARLNVFDGNFLILPLNGANSFLVLEKYFTKIKHCHMSLFASKNNFGGLIISGKINLERNHGHSLNLSDVKLSPAHDGVDFLELFESKSTIRSSES